MTFKTRSTSNGTTRTSFKLSYRETVLDIMRDSQVYGWPLVEPFMASHPEGVATEHSLTITVEMWLHLNGHQQIDWVSDYLSLDTSQLVSTKV